MVLFGHGNGKHRICRNNLLPEHKAEESSEGRQFPGHRATLVLVIKRVDKRSDHRRINQVRIIRIDTIGKFAKVAVITFDRINGITFLNFEPPNKLVKT